MTTEPKTERTLVRLLDAWAVEPKGAEPLGRPGSRRYAYVDVFHGGEFAGTLHVKREASRAVAEHIRNATPSGIDHAAVEAMRNACDLTIREAPHHPTCPITTGEYTEHGMQYCTCAHIRAVQNALAKLALARPEPKGENSDTDD